MLANFCACEFHQTITSIFPFASTSRQIASAGWPASLGRTPSEVKFCIDEVGFRLQTEAARALSLPVI